MQEVALSLSLPPPPPPIVVLLGDEGGEVSNSTEDEAKKQDGVPPTLPPPTAPGKATADAWNRLAPQGDVEMQEEAFLPPLPPVGELLEGEATDTLDADRALTTTGGGGQSAQL